jgi:hypothetical protein
VPLNTPRFKRSDRKTAPDKDFVGILTELSMIKIAEKHLAVLLKSEGTPAGG